MEKKDGFLQSLRERLVEYYHKLDPLLKEKEVLEDKIARIQQCIEGIKLLDEAERARLGEAMASKQLPPIPDHKFESLTLPEACRGLLQENTPMSLEQFKESLKKGGFKFDKRKKPGRQIHFTLVQIPQAKRRKDGFWEWQGQIPGR